MKTLTTFFLVRYFAQKINDEVFSLSIPGLPDPTTGCSDRVFPLFACFYISIIGFYGVAGKDGKCATV